MNKESNPKLMTGLEIQREGVEKSQDFQVWLDSLKDAAIYAVENKQYLTDRFNKARDQRSRPYRELDENTYELDYYANLDAKNSFLKPKKNDSEVRVNTGTTEKKIESVQNELLGMNLRSEFVAFDDEDSEVVELGDDMTDVVRRTEQQNNEDDLNVEIIAELLTQRIVYVEEYFEECEKKLRNGKTKLIRRPRRRLINGLQIYLGDMTIPAYLFNSQPYYFKYERVSYTEAMKRFPLDKFPQAKYIKPGMATMEANGAASWYKYRFSQLANEECEILSYYSAADGEMQVVCQGILMFKPKEPLDWTHDGYNMAVGTLKSLGPNFALGRPLTSSSKYLQSMSNEMIRLVIRKFRQAMDPPSVTSSKKIFSRDIFEPSAMTIGVKKGEIERLIDHNGVTQSEFAVMEYISQKTEEFIGRGDLAQGIANGKTMTATQTLEMQKQAMKMLGLAVYAWMRLRRDMSMLRLYTISDKMFDPIGSKLNPFTQKIDKTYRKFTILDAKFKDNTRGRKIVQFTDRELEPTELDAVRSFEDKQPEKTRVKFVNLDILKSINLIWYVNVTQHEPEGSALNKVLFQDSLAQAATIQNLTGRRINADTLIQRYERTWKEDDMFEEAAPDNIFGTQEGQPMGEEGVDVRDEASKLLQEIDGGVMKDGLNMQNAGGKKTMRPTINTLNGQAG